MVTLTISVTICTFFVFIEKKQERDDIWFSCRMLLFKNYSDFNAGAVYVF